MPLIFPKSMNRMVPLVAIFAACCGAFIIFAFWYWASPKYTDAGYAPLQPVPFSHRKHAGELKIDCRYCHNTVEFSAYAAIPPTQTCMNCHATIRKDSKKLALVRESHKSGKPLKWYRVHLLPDYAFFDHSLHLRSGVGCSSCHGRIDEMETVQQVKPLSMSWCVDCHRNPTPHLRPLNAVTQMDWDQKRSSYDANNDPNRPYPPNPPLHCSGCHR